jgi:hypothetical protein
MNDERDQKPETGNWKPESEISAGKLQPSAFSLSGNGSGEDQVAMLWDSPGTPLIASPDLSTLGFLAACPWGSGSPKIPAKYDPSDLLHEFLSSR